MVGRCRSFFTESTIIAEFLHEKTTILNTPRGGICHWVLSLNEALPWRGSSRTAAVSVLQMIKDQMEKIYSEMSPDDIPWHMETPPTVLQALVTDHLLKPCKVIELGCGTGNYVLYFSRNYFDATGVDISENAIRIARESASRDGLECTFVVADVLGDLSELGNTFDFAYDWELLHHIFPEDRKKYIENVWSLLKPKGRYLSVCFSEESGQFGGVGKYRKTPLGTTLYFSNEREIRSLFEKRFNVEELRTIEIQGKRAIHKVIYALTMKSG